ncbi:MAG: outer-membrane lipoprotein carrier protein LolA [Candidatus Schekmanbacteria bacterium]|nr:outer-membrane lipoprotein carrier protein LolA [Candidatus Schekmanbacteria bacterium]
MTRKVIAFLLLTMGSHAPLASSAAGWPPDIEAGQVVAEFARQLRASGLVRRCFVQSTLNSSLGSTTEERGTVLLSVPGRMRWDYASGKVLVASDDNLVFYLPEERLAYVGSYAEASGTQIGLLLLAGATEVDKAIDAAWARAWTPLAGLWRLELRDRSEASSPEPARISVDLTPLPELELRAVRVEDAYGNRTEILLSKCPRDADQSESTFAFSLPQGTEVVDFAGNPVPKAPESTRDSGVEAPRRSGEAIQ